MSKSKVKAFITSFLILSNIVWLNAQDLALNEINSHKENINSHSDINQIVYVCTGKYAYAYHSTDKCPGLNNCGSQIIKTNEEDVLKSRWNKPCCRCWSNVKNNCKDDNPNYGSNAYGGGSSNNNDDVGGAVVLAIVAGSAIILSNDLYVYRINSFFDNNIDTGINTSQIGNSKGWAFGFRKTFNKSALEYGMSIFQTEIKYSNTFSNTSEKYKFNLNYIHNLFDSKFPKNLKVYLGPTINASDILDNIGYGGVIGTNYRIFDRLKIDLRYEITNQTNQIQLGLIFNYQKKYFWQ
jgi:hypothetical protein